MIDITSEDYVSPRRRFELTVRDMWHLGGLKIIKAKALRACDPRKFMTARERKAFDALPNEFTVYQGSQGAQGLSWSLSRGVAEGFASLRTKLPKGEVLERRVKKSEVFAYVSGNGEREVIILPKSIKPGRKKKS
jgi:hypothetical protein